MLWELQEIYESILQESVGKTLYHGTCKSNFEDSPKDVTLYGGDPKNKKSLLGSSYDDYSDEDIENYNLQIPIFAADKQTFDKSVTAMKWCLASKKAPEGKRPNMHDVTWNDVRNDGIIFIFYDTDTEYDWEKHDPYGYSDNSEKYIGLEDEDYFKPDSARPDGWWEGSKLVSILKRKGYNFK